MEPPLTLSVDHLTPHLLIPSDSPPFDLSPVPATPLPQPNPPSPTQWSLSPTHNYPAPWGSMSLGGMFRTTIRLTNHLKDRPVMGVKMMLEIQGPGGRYRLGEIIHGQTSPAVDNDAGNAGEDDGKAEKEGVREGGKEDDGKLPELAIGESISLEVENEMKELGLQVLICSVAWETLDGRRTFQRFMKFNVNPPLSIKTRVHTATSPNTSLNPHTRSNVHLEVLMQNIGPEGMTFDKVILEPVQGMSAERVHHLPSSSVSSLPSSSLASKDGESEKEQKEQVFTGEMSTLLPNDSRQYLFLLSPIPPADTSAAISVFPPVYPGGMVLPLGRLDVAWRSGRYHDPGRLQTSTLNRRVPMAPIAPRISSPSPAPTRTMSAAPPSPAGPSSRASTVPPPVAAATGNSPGPPLPAKDEEQYEFDLVVTKLERDGVQVDTEFPMALRLGVRSSKSLAHNTDEGPPGRIYLAIQYLSSPAPPLPNLSTSIKNPPNPQIAFSPPSRSHTPQTPGLAGLAPPSPFSPPTAAGGSRPMTPVSSELRRAASSHITLPGLLPSASISSFSGTGSNESLENIFPPIPILSKIPVPHSKRLPISAQMVGEIQHLGASMEILPFGEWVLVEEQFETTYPSGSNSTHQEKPASKKRWETTYEIPWRFIALEEGLASLGGVRVLILEDDSGLKGYTAKEWDSLGDVWVVA